MKENYGIEKGAKSPYRDVINNGKLMKSSLQTALNLEVLNIVIIVPKKQVQIVLLNALEILIRVQQSGE